MKLSLNSIGSFVICIINMISSVPCYKHNNRAVQIVTVFQKWIVREQIRIVGQQHNLGFYFSWMSVPDESKSGRAVLTQFY